MGWLIVAIPFLLGAAVYRWGPHKGDTDAQGALATLVFFGAFGLEVVGSILS